jgi:hypothetical protein
MQFLIEHRVVIAAVAFALFVGFRVWQSGVLKSITLPSFASKGPSVRDDLDALLDILARAKKRESVARVHLKEAIDAFLNEVTA